MSDTICKEHSGCLSDIDHLQRSDTEQWIAIKEMKSQHTQILTATILTLVGMLANLVFMLFKVVK